MTPTLYKVLDLTGKAYHGGHGYWNLPTADQPGAWMPKITPPLIPCEHGYHLCRPSDLVFWLGPAIYRVEVRGVWIKAGTKVVAAEARLLSQVTTWTAALSRTFAADCAKRVLPLFECWCPDDPRPRKAIIAARRLGTNLARTLTTSTYSAAAAASAAADAADAAVTDASFASSAAASAAYAAASAAAYAAVTDASSAASAAAYAAYSAASAASFASSAASAAADAAASAAAYAAASETEHAWQTAHLLSLLGETGKGEE